jgi:TatD DNase family protein
VLACEPQKAGRQLCAYNTWVLIDTHCHLYFDSFDTDRADVLGRMAAASVSGAVLPALDADTAAQARALCLAHPHLRYAAGWHPGYVAPLEYMRDGRFDAGAGLAQWWEHAPLPVAVGEIGLDGREGVNPMPVQIALFTAQLAFARERGVPAIVHLRDADSEMLDVLETVPGTRGVFHCFGGNPAILDYAVRHGWFISFAGNLTFPKAQALRDSAQQAPLELLMVETDSPFLAPQPVRGKRCEPAYVIHTARELARLRGIPEIMLHQLLTDNASRCFGVVWAAAS